MGFFSCAANEQRDRRPGLQAIQGLRHNILLQPLKIRPLQINLQTDRARVTGRDVLQLPLKAFALKIGVVRKDTDLEHLADFLFKRQRSRGRYGALREGASAKPEGTGNSVARWKQTEPMRF